MATPEDFKKEYKGSPISDLVNAERILKAANNEFDSDKFKTKFEVAYKYLAVADYDEKNNVSVLENDAGHLYHFAGHHFRFVENWNGAANAYSSGGDCSMKANDFDWAIRCYARAKVCFQDVGDSELAGEAYIKEQDAKKAKYKRDKKHVQHFWYRLRKRTTNYGESFKRWFISFILVIFIFTCLYSALELCIHWPHHFKMKAFLSNIYLYFAITLGFGEIIQVPWQAKIVIAMNLASGYTMLALGIDIIIRKFKES